MKATLTFTYDLNNDEERDDMKIILDAHKYHSATCELYQYLRRKLKYEELNEIEQKVYEEVRENFNEIFSDLDF
jgi:hypothetical protein